MRKKLFLSSILVLNIVIFSSVLLFGCGVCGIFGGSDKTTKTTFSIEGMTCKKCVSKVKTSLIKVEGVKKVKVSLKNKKATVKYDKDKVTIEEFEKGTVSVNQLIEAVNKTGFQAKSAK